MAESIKLIECPRDAWQGLPGQIPSATKVEYLKALVAAGFKHIDAVSFVSPKAVPQMADSETVLSELDPPDDVEIIAIVVNERGVERAIATDAVRTVGFPYSLSPTFLKNNQNQTPEENLDILEQVKQKADEGGLDTIAYISMAFGNPYGDLWNDEELMEGVGCSPTWTCRRSRWRTPWGWQRRSRLPIRSARCWRCSAIWKSVSICTAAPTKPWTKCWPPMMPDAAGSIPRSAAWAAARLRRMCWWAISRRRKFWRPCNSAA